MAKNFLIVVLFSCLVMEFGCARFQKKSAPPVVSKKTVVPQKSETVPTQNLASLKIQKQYDIGIRAYQNGRYKAALAAFDLAAQMDGRFALPHYGRGLVMLKMENYQGAASAFSGAIFRKPNFSQAYHGLGFAQRALGQFQDAKKAYLAGLKYDQRSAPIYYNLGILYDVYLGKPKTALKYYREYVKLSGKDGERVKAWIQIIEQKTAS